MLKPMMKTAAAAAALLALPCLGAEPVHLGYKFDATTPIHHQMVQEMTQTQAFQGQTMETITKTSSRVTTELLKANEDGSVLIATTPESMTMSISAPGMDLSYDSANAADKAKLSNPTIASVAGMVGLQVQMLIAPDGEILDIPNIDQLQKAVDAMPDANVKTAMSQSMGKDTIMASNEMNYKLLPAEAVEVGDEWSREFKIPMGFGDMTVTLDMTLNGVEKGIAEISIDGSVTMPQIQQQGMTMNLGSSELSGTLRFNIEDGVQESYDLTTSMDLSATMDGMEGSAPVFTMNMEQRVKLDRVKD